MRLSQSFFATLREVPRDAEVVSHQLMARSGMLRKHAAGIYSYLPLMVRSYHKLSAIVREELDAVGWQEVIMPFVIPAELWQESGRWDAMGRELTRIKDRKQGDFCLGPTHEEVVTDIVRGQVNSYKQLPVTLYQMTPKFRDEVRPRFGVMRGREFVMMDAYSFSATSEDLDRIYQDAAQAYTNIFRRAGLSFVSVEADTGAIGGSGSHEFHVLADSGEDLILSCAEANYAANVEKAETPRPEQQAPGWWGTATTQSLQEVATPNARTIEEVGALLEVPPQRCLKTLVYRYTTLKEPKNWVPVVAFVAGHRKLNEVKLRSELSRRGFEVFLLEPMPEADVAALFQCPVGFLGPIGAPQGILALYDREVPAIHDGVAGANKVDAHWNHLEPARDLPQLNSSSVVDLVTAVDGDLCPRSEGQGRYIAKRGIEVGHIFKLGTKYSKAMNATFQNEAKENHPFIMGCYGIGVTRTLAAAIEQNFDKDGIIWPEAIAPYQVHLISAGHDDPAVMEAARLIYETLQKQRIEVLFDDRDLSPGVKFKDADLIGIPRRVVVGKKTLAEGLIEVVLRRDKSANRVPYDAQNPSKTCDAALNFGR